LIGLVLRLQPNQSAPQIEIVGSKTFEPLHDGCIGRVMVCTPFNGSQHSVDLSMKVLYRRIVGQDGIDVGRSI
jgi:hypothetical protein